MDFFSNDGRRIQTFADWRDRGGPVSSRDWAEGRSLRELARAWTEGDAEAEVTALLGLAPEFGGVVLDRGIAAKETRFDAFPDDGRHDLLVIGRAPNGTVVIGVEAKADEPLDEPLDAWLARELARNDTWNAEERLDALTTAFFGTRLNDDPLLAPLRYRLLSTLARTLADAREQAATRAVLLVHEFETPWTNDELHQRNAADLEAFVGRLMPGVERMTDERAWIAGPYAIAETDVYVARLVTNTRSP